MFRWVSIELRIWFFVWNRRAGRPESFRSQTMKIDLLNKEKSSEPSGQNAGGSSDFKSGDFFPQFAGFGSFASVEEAMNRVDFRYIGSSFRLGFYEIFRFWSLYWESRELVAHEFGFDWIIGRLQRRSRKPLRWRYFTPDKCWCSMIFRPIRPERLCC